MKKIFTLFTTLILAVSMMAQSQNFWKDVQPETALSTPELKNYLPTAHTRTLSLDYDEIRQYLKAAPVENTAAATQSPLLLDIPMPDGEMMSFGIYEISMMQPGLAAAFPSIKTYAGNSQTLPGVFTRITTGPLGFHATIFTGEKADVVEALSINEVNKYAAYHLDDAHDAGPVGCGNHDDTIEETLLAELSEDQEVTFSNEKAVVPVDLRTYRLAVATTAEYSNQNGGNATSVLNAVTAVVNQANAIFEKDNAIRMILIANTSDAFYYPPVNNDPYENGDAGAMISVNVTVLNQAFGPDGYDIGHVFGTAPGGGTVGLGALASVCTDIKARGVSNTLGPNFYKTVTHEFGHQFNATHTFNFCDADNENPPTGYEPGGGSAIMSYTGTGVCGSNAVVQSGEDYFHINSLERILAFSTSPFSGGSCAQIIDTDNNTPEASLSMNGGFVIPISTPFELTGEATDQDGDMLTYTWEQYDLGPMSPLGSPIGNAPLFRSYPPTNNPTRIFPRIQTIVSNGSSVNEVLPTITRDLTFRFTARDNAETGGYSYAEIAFTSTENAGPFLVSSPNTGSESWEAGQYMEVSWDVANTDGAQVNCQLVDIYLSKDGGFTYPVTLLEGTPNDGSAFVVVPDEVTDLARVKVKGRDNIFFDISNEDFSIVAASVPDFTVSSYGPEYGQVCIPESFDVTLETAPVLGFTEMITFSAAGFPAGATVSFSTNPVMPGASTVATFDFSNVSFDGDASVSILAEATGVDAEERIVELNVVSSDFSALTLNEPSGSAVTTLPTYEWSDLPNGHAYDIEIATDAEFTNIIDSGTGLSSSDYTGGITLEENTVYYWRVRVTNECGTGDFGEIRAFKTISQVCNTTSSTEVVDIPGSNGSIVTSVINVPVGGEISDVNINNLSGIYNAFGDIVFRLIGPSTTVQLMNQEPCANPGAFNLGFDDQAAQTDIPCPPPATGTSYQPAGDLVDFNGQDAAGDWTLEVEVVTNFGAGGMIDGWDLEICGSATPLDPYVVINDTLGVPPGMTNLIYIDKLLVEDDDNTPLELTITITKETEHGFVSLSGQQLGVGDSFTMHDVYASQVEYTNTNTSALTDHFTFFVEDVTGGFFGLPNFNIKIDEDAVIGAAGDLLDDGALSVFPNPATDLLTVELVDNTLQMEEVSLFNSQGQIVLNQTLNGLSGKTQVPVNDQPAGVYFVQVKTEAGVAVRKVVIE